MFEWLFGTKKEVVPANKVEGDGYHEHDVVGESFYGDALRSLMSGVESLNGGWEKREVVAHLIPVSNNPHDANAVEVRIEGHKVGHLDRATAKAYRNTNGLGNSPVSVDALIVGKEGNFGVKLDLIKE